MTKDSIWEILLATYSWIFLGLGRVTFLAFHVLNSTKFIITFQQRPKKN
ncbi:MAG: hypothetical protein O4751_01365 [Trichodesmium sp. St2_bin6]|nr:hypothetical protein [Trichodesmium sp. St2_bin6]